jgi:hypothetical protein
VRGKSSIYHPWKEGILKGALVMCKDGARQKPNLNAEEQKPERKDCCTLEMTNKLEKK